MGREAQFGVALAVAVVDHPRDRAPGSPRLSEVLDPAWLDDAACASEMQAVAVMRAVGRLRGRPGPGHLPHPRPHGRQHRAGPRAPAARHLARAGRRAHRPAPRVGARRRPRLATARRVGRGRRRRRGEALAWAIAGEGPYRLRNRTAALLLEHDAAAADRARKEAARTTDVTLQGRRDGLTDLTITLEPDVAAACRDATDRYARMWKADGDDRPIGQLRTLVAADLLLRAWDTSRPAVTAHITVHAPLPSLRPSDHPGGTAPQQPASAQADDGVERCGTVGGQPVTSAHLRELLRRWTDVGLDGLHAPDGGSLDIALADPDTGELRAVVTEPELRRAARRPCPRHPDDPVGCGCAAIDRPPPTTAYRPTAAHRRFVGARDRGCRHPGCSRPAIWTDLDHVTAHDRGGSTDCANLCTLCRRHHRLKTHAPGWRFTMTGDGVLAVTTPSGVTRTTRPPGTGHALTRLDQLLHPDDEPVELDLVPTSPTPEPDDDPPPF